MTSSIYPPYEIKYAVIPSSLVYNECGPQSIGPVGNDSRAVEKRSRAAQRYIDRLNEKNGFYAKLEESILKDGVRNPILVNAGYINPRKLPKLPMAMQDDHDKILVCHSLGGSRLWVTQKHNLDIPCLINDACNMFPDLPPLTDDEIMPLFKDAPRAIRRTAAGLVVSNLPQVHLDE